MGRRAITLTTTLITAAGLGAAATTAGAAGPGEVRIGSLVALSGELGAAGPARSRANRLAADALNRAAAGAGVDLRVALLEEDTRTNSTVALEAAGRLVDRSGVSCFVGPETSTNVLAVAEIVSVDAGVPLISPSATASLISAFPDADLVFRAAPSDALQGPLLAREVAAAVGRRATVNVGSRDDVYGRSLVREFSRAWRAGGGTVGRSVRWRPTARNLRPAAAQLAGGGPAAWVVVDFPTTWARMRTALRGTPFRPSRTFTTDGLRDSAAARPANAGLRGVAPTDRGAPGAAAFQRLWDANAGGPRALFDANQFDSVVLCGLAAAKAGSADPARIAAEIRAVSGPPGTRYTLEQLPQALADLKAGKDIDYEGTSGVLNLDRRGDPSGVRYVRWSIRGGRIVDAAGLVRPR